MHAVMQIFGFCAVALFGVAGYFAHAANHDEVDDYANAVAALFFGGLAALCALAWLGALLSETSGP